MNEYSSQRLSQLRRRPLGRYRYVRLRWRVLFAIVDTLGATIVTLLRGARRLLGRSAGFERDAYDPKRILLVQLDHLGDAVITTAMLPSLRRRYPEASIEILASPCNREIFETSPYVDRVDVSCVNRFSRSTSRLAWVWGTLWWGLRLRRRKIDMAIDPRGEFSVVLILWLAGAKRRVGWESGGGQFLLTDSSSFVAGRPELDSRRALLGILGIETSSPFLPPPPMTPVSLGDNGEIPRGMQSSGSAYDGIHCTQAAVQDHLGPHFQKSSSIIMHVGAGMSAKRWPIHHWRELIGRLIVDQETQVVLVGNEQDRIISRAILGDRPWPNVIELVGRLSIRELALTLQGAKLFIGADSGPAHIAAAVGTPAIVLFSGTNESRQWAPQGPTLVSIVKEPVACSPCHQRRCLRPGHPCMQRISPLDVASEIEYVLSRCTGQGATGPDRGGARQGRGRSHTTGNRCWEKEGGKLSCRKGASA